LVWSPILYAQAILKGKVVDISTKEPLENAVITSREGRATAISDERGNFQLPVEGSSDTVRVSFIGYETISAPAWRTGESRLIELKHGTIDLQVVTIHPMPMNASFSTITHIDLNLHALNSAQDLMRLVPGLSLMQHQGGGIADHIFFRGFDADHGTDLGVSVDGMPVNMVSHIHGQGFSDLHFIIPELVTSLEYGKGPYYSDRGDFATAGYIDFRIRDVLERNELKMEGGQFHTGRIMGSFNLLGDKARQNEQTAYIAGEGFYTDGPFDLPQHFNRGNLFGKYLLKLSPKTGLKLTLSTFSSLWQSSGEIPARAISDGLVSRWGVIDSTQGGNTSRTTGILRLTTAVSDHLTIENQFYYSHYFFDLGYDQTFFADDSVNGDRLRQHESRDQVGYMGKVSHRAYLAGTAELRSSAGLGFQADAIRGSELSHTKQSGEILDYIQHGDIREWTVHAFLDEQYLKGKWQFDAGARVDYLHFQYRDLLNPGQAPLGRAVVSPKINIGYTVNDKLQIYARTGKGFHSNDAKVALQDRGAGMLPAAYGADLGLNWKPLPRLYVNAAAWYLFLQQEFVYEGDEGVFEPGDRTQRQGLDLSARYEFTGWLHANLDLIATRARDAAAPKGNDYLPLAVPFYGSAGLFIKLPNGINGGWTARFMANRPANADNSMIAEGYILNDLTANYTKHKFEIGVEIQNLFNATWRDAQYEIGSRLKNESQPVDDMSYTPGSPFFARVKFAVFF
jgi:hypothetical protein